MSRDSASREQTEKRDEAPKSKSLTTNKLCAALYINLGMNKLPQFLAALPFDTSTTCFIYDHYDTVSSPSTICI